MCQSLRKAAVMCETNPSHVVPNETSLFLGRWLRHAQDVRLIPEPLYDPDPELPDADLRLLSEYCRSDLRL